VVDAVSRQPIAMADVSVLRDGNHSPSLVVKTDARGEFRLPQRRARDQILAINHFWYQPDTTVVPDSAWQKGEVQFALHPRARPCCEMRGRWRLTLQLDRAPSDQAYRDALPGPAYGQLEFGPHHRDVMAPFATRYDAPSSPYEPGRFLVNWRPLFPGRHPPTRPELDSLRTEWGRSHFDEWQRTTEGAVAISLGGDSVFISLGVHSNGVALSGRIQADSIVGRWQDPFYGGRFVMARVPANRPWPSN
jgi:hypothetical protein